MRRKINPKLLDSEDSSKDLLKLLIFIHHFLPH